MGKSCIDRGVVEWVVGHSGYIVLEGPEKSQTGDCQEKPRRSRKDSFKE